MRNQHICCPSLYLWKQFTFSAFVLCHLSQGFIGFNNNAFRKNLNNRCTFSSGLIFYSLRQNGQFHNCQS